ncbi:MAG TPA: tetraacyldisaccharide 4'-kinase [Alphaproteobacteria bacterium]|nr:tetraacyldisaccharide 4'-kinase [Alphaproteobacteria bacterium]
MKTPRFWYRPRGAAATVLAPLGQVYDAAGRLRRSLANPHRAGIPVICVGNLVAGGAGKTPVAIAIVRHLKQRGVDAHFLTRGYRGREKGPVRVDLARHDARAVGDEPMLLAAVAPTWVARDRARGAAAAEAAGAAAIVMDDGFQNPRLAKDLSFLVVDGEVGFGNRQVIPAGPLRETARGGLARATAVIVMGDDRHGIGVEAAARGLPVLHGRLRPAGRTDWLRGSAVVAFAGIARPDKFFDTLKALGARLVADFGYGDHHRFRPDEIMQMADLAGAAGALLVTTAKDYARLPDEARPMVKVLAVEVAWADEAALARILEPVLRHGE